MDHMDVNDRIWTCRARELAGALRRARRGPPPLCELLHSSLLPELSYIDVLCHIRPSGSNAARLGLSAH